MKLQSCNICKIEPEQLETIPPPINSKLWSDEILEFNGFRVVYVGKIPTYYDENNENSNIKFYKFWNICSDCHQQIVHERGKLDLPFELSTEEIKTILTEGIENYIINQKELDHQKELEAWRNRKKYRKQRKRK